LVLRSKVVSVFVRFRAPLVSRNPAVYTCLAVIDGSALPFQQGSTRSTVFGISSALFLLWKHQMALDRIAEFY
jgi:hypothetical protein